MEIFFLGTPEGLGEGRQRPTAVHPTPPPRTFRRRGHEGAAAPHAPTSLGRRAADLESSLERFTAPRLGAFSTGVVWARELGRGLPRSPPHTWPRAHIPREHGRALASRRRRGVVRGRCGGEHHRPRRRPALAKRVPHLGWRRQGSRARTGARRSPRRHPDIPRRRRRRHPRARQEDLRESLRVGARRGGGRRAIVRVVGEQSAPLGGTPAPRSRPPPPGPPTAHPNPPHTSKVTGTVYAGDMCAVMGPSGAGKTTLLDIISKRKTEGKVLGKVRKHTAVRREDAAFSPPRNPAPDRRHLPMTPRTTPSPRYTSTVPFPPSRR